MLACVCSYQLFHNKTKIYKISLVIYFSINVAFYQNQAPKKKKAKKETPAKKPAPAKKETKKKEKPTPQKKKGMCTFGLKGIAVDIYNSRKFAN